MRIKLHIGLVITLLTLLGMYSGGSTIPNQQIVIQFSDNAIAKKDTENTLLIVKTHLQRLGVEAIQIRQLQNGQLRITYYSDSDVEAIQNILSKSNNLRFDYASNKKNSDDEPQQDESLKHYKLNVSKIRKDLNTNRGVKGVQVVELHHKSDRFYYPKINVSAYYINDRLSKIITQLAQQINNQININIGAIVYILPKVRAGPTTSENG